MWWTSYIIFVNATNVALDNSNKTKSNTGPPSVFFCIAVNSGETMITKKIISALMETVGWIISVHVKFLH